MRLIVYTIVYLFGLALLSSVLAWFIASFLDYDYLKILSRTLLLLVALSLIPLWRLNGMTREAVGLSNFSWRPFSASIVLSIVMLLPLMLLFLMSGFRILDPRVDILSSDFAQTLMIVGVGAILVGIFEETLFRGFLQKVVGDRIGITRSIWVISIGYGLVHFLEPSHVVVDQVEIFTGISLIATAFLGVASFGEEITSFATLVAIGAFLGYTRERFGLWIAIGLHTGWVMAIRTFKELTVRDVFNPFAAWTGTYDNFIGPLALFWLLFGYVLFRLYQLHCENLQVDSR